MLMFFLNVRSLDLVQRNWLIWRQEHWKKNCKINSILPEAQDDLSYLISYGVAFEKIKIKQFQ